MQQYFIAGNQFQNHMLAKFNLDITSASANMSNVRGKEDLVYGYVRDIASLFQPVRYGLQDNPMGLYSDYESFKKHFVRYWKNALDISKADLEEVRDVFDNEMSSQESCKNRAVTSVFFENGKALTIEDCLEAIYEVFKMV
ncbi:MAG: hypothetical protein NC489_45645 [Ruminococcus flavefaciens]|nr:hypothetical protein [Ruminococcus flavefaciens]